MAFDPPKTTHPWHRNETEMVRGLGVVPPKKYQTHEKLITFSIILASFNLLLSFGGEFVSSPPKYGTS